MKNDANASIKKANFDAEISKALREQAYIAFELIATGIWSAIVVKKNPVLHNVLRDHYNFECNLQNFKNKSDLLKIIHVESIVLLIRILLLFYCGESYYFVKNNSISDKSSHSIALSNAIKKLGKLCNNSLLSDASHPLLHDLEIDNDLFANAIDNLCRVQIKDKFYTVDFSAISVRELGAIYESLLEYKLAVVDRDMDELPSLISNKRIRHNVKKGDLYLINHTGERKASGSYYTPDLIVEHLVKSTLDPKLNVAKMANPDDFNALISAVSHIKVCDPAMGSGHMLQSAYMYIVNFLRQSLEEMSDAGKTSLVWDSDMEFRVRSLIAKKCIYGIDLNPYAVELAKLVLWIRVFRHDKPFEFFDYNLICGNSLIGLYENAKIKDNAGYNRQEQGTLVKSIDEKEADIYSRLSSKVKEMLEMERQTVDDIHWVRRFYDDEITKNFKPIHWDIAFPNVVSDGGFDVVLSNPPWDKVKANHNEFFSDYIDGYADMEAAEAKKYSADLMEKNPELKKDWKAYNYRIDTQNNFYQTYYSWQIYKSGSGEKFSGDANLYKVFLEKIFEILADSGTGGVVVPNNIDLDAGCTGLRHMLLENARIKELIMFENRKKLFDIDSRYKFNTLIFEKTLPPDTDYSFTAGFYWYDPIWLDKIPDAKYIAQNERNKPEYHKRFEYSTAFIKKTNPDLLTIYEFKNKQFIDIFEKMI